MLNSMYLNTFGINFPEFFRATGGQYIIRQWYSRPVAEENKVISHPAYLFLVQFRLLLLTEVAHSRCNDTHIKALYTAAAQKVAPNLIKVEIKVEKQISKFRAHTHTHTIRLEHSFAADTGAPLLSECHEAPDL